ncbi:MAG: histidine phosphatase family protein [Desulfobacterales bacterium]
MPDPSPPATFLIIRHAATHWNAHRRIQGHQDTPLTPEGIGQALSWGKRLKACAVDRILASDLGRAVETARLINQSLGVPVETDPRLREQDWGEWSGLTMNRIREQHPEKLAVETTAPWFFQPPAGEDRLSVLARAHRCLEEAASRWPASRILVVSHEGVIKALLYFLASRCSSRRKLSRIRPDHLHVLTGTAETLRIKALNRMALEVAG